MLEKLYRGVERVIGLALAVIAVTIGIADQIDPLDPFIPDGFVASFTLTVLGTVTIFLILQMNNIRKVETVETTLKQLDIPTLAMQLRDSNYGGLTRVHKQLANDLFCDYVDEAKRVTILNTWIPNLDVLKDSVDAAVRRGAEVRILLLHPKSMVAGLRTDALRAGGLEKFDDQVTDGVKRCLSTLEAMHKRLTRRRKSCLKVRVFNSLPSVSVYRADEHYLVSVFLHGQLAINSPQFEITGTDTVLGKQIQTELDTLWDIGNDIDLDDWPRSVDSILT